MPTYPSAPSLLVLATTLLLVLSAAERLDALPPEPSQQPSLSLPVGALPAVGPIRLTFSQFKREYGKTYSSLAEQRFREHVFHANLRRLNKHHQNSSRTYNMKPNQFLDVTTAEFRQHFTRTYRSDQHSHNLSDAYLHTRANRTNQMHTLTPHTHSEREEESTSEADRFKGNQTETHSQDDQPALNNNSSRVLAEAVSPATAVKEIDWSIHAGSVKYQGFCGACYAFTAVDTFSAMNAIHRYGFFLSLSVQQVLDCSTNNLTFGCGGGYLEGAFTYIQLNGLTTEQAYPYASVNTGKTGKCLKEGGSFRLSSFSSIAEGDCNAVISSLALGPLSAGIAGYNLQFYDSGVFNDCNDVLDHAVVIVGYRSGYGWRIKNSWGVKWGDGGLGWIAEGNTCGICNMVVSIAL